MTTYTALFMTLLALAGVLTLAHGLRHLIRFISYPAWNPGQRRPPYDSLETALLLVPSGAVIVAFTIWAVLST